jgi:hypothetical protein
MARWCPYISFSGESIIPSIPCPSGFFLFTLGLLFLGRVLRPGMLSPGIGGECIIEPSSGEPSLVLDRFFGFGFVGVS